MMKIPKILPALTPEIPRLYFVRGSEIILTAKRTKNPMNSLQMMRTNNATTKTRPSKTAYSNDMITLTDLEITW